MGDMNKWVELARFNDLRHPYIVETTEEKMKNPNHLVTIGDTILIRVSQDNQANLIGNLRRAPEYNQEQIYALALGKDLDITPINEDSYNDNENLELKANARGDVKTVRGIENLKQSLFIRLITPKGSYLGHPNYGSNIDKYLGKKNTEENAKLINLEIERTLRSDSRVTNVIANGHDISGETLTTSFTVYTLGLEEAFEFVITTEQDGPIVLLDTAV